MMQMAKGIKGFRGEMLSVSRDPHRHPDAVRYEPDGLFIVEDGLIVARGDYASLAPSYPGIPIDHLPGLVVPGFIDTHLHIESSLVTPHEFDRCVQINIGGTFRITQQAVRRMRAQTRGSIVNISSTRAVMSEPNSYGYAAAKGGLDALTHAMAVSLGPKIRVNAIRPGWIETRNWQKQANREQVEHREQDKAQHPVGRVGNPEDIAQTVDWLIGAGFVTGQAINVDGGMTVKMIYEH